MTTTTTTTKSLPEVDPGILKDRIVGSILGVFIGNALGVGVHWQYDLDKLVKERGYVTGYLDPLPGTYHSGTPDAPGRGQRRSAGQLEQQGELAKQLLASLAERGALDQRDFWQRFENVILKDPTMDGTRQGGKYGWTDKSICDIYQCRIVERKAWPDCAPPRSDTPDAVVRAALIAGLYYQTPHELAVQVQIHAQAATGDSSVQAHSVAFASLIAAAIQGVPLTHQMTDFLYQQPGRSLPYTSMMASSKDYDVEYGPYSEPDSLLWFGAIAKSTEEFGSSIQPPHRGVLLYGQFCAFFATLPSSYYCTARFANDFEQAVLCAVNGGGQNTMRTSLTGALVGAALGKGRIPQRFLDGLDDVETILRLAEQVADMAVSRGATRGGDPQDAWYWPSAAEVNFTIGETTTHTKQQDQGVGLPDTSLVRTTKGPHHYPITSAVGLVLVLLACGVWFYRACNGLSERKTKYQSLDDGSNGA